MLFYFVFLENREENLRHSVLANELTSSVETIGSDLQGEENCKAVSLLGPSVE